VTFDEIVDEVLGTRFDESQRTFAKNWVNARLLKVWNTPGVRWEFVYTRDEALAVTASAASLDLDAIVGTVEDVYDDDGNPLLELSKREYDEGAYSTTSSGTPTAYTVVGRQLLLYPTPSASKTFKFTYNRRPYHLDDSGDVVVGPMSDDDDTPPWNDSYHHILVPGGVAAGLLYENDPAFAAFEQEFTDELDAMADELCVLVSGEQYGRIEGC
jgi:hypothetical protein